jgi:haloalkane dehalogenase
MEILRTPEERFADLPDYPFAPHYAQVGEVRIHYVDEGPRQAPPVLLLHGEPSWSFLYRKMIPPIAAAGFRVVAPDLVGFGKSDKPARREDYTYQRHVDWIRGLLELLDLREIVLFGQDWGGLIGLRLAAEHPDRFARIVAANTFLPTGDVDLGPAFEAWKKFSQEVPEFPVGRIVQSGCVNPLPPEVVAAYDAPFPDESYKAGARQFPVLVPARPDDPAAPANRRAWEVLSRWDEPFLTVFGDSDPITRGADRILQQVIPGARGQPHRTIQGAGHFLQEDKGEELAEIVIAFAGGSTSGNPARASHSRNPGGAP